MHWEELATCVQYCEPQLHWEELSTCVQYCEPQCTERNYRPVCNTVNHSALRGTIDMRTMLWTTVHWEELSTCVQCCEPQCTERNYRPQANKWSKLVETVWPILFSSPKNDKHCHSSWRFHGFLRFLMVCDIIVSSLFTFRGNYTSLFEVMLAQSALWNKLRTQKLSALCGTFSSQVGLHQRICAKAARKQNVLCGLELKFRRIVPKFRNSSRAQQLLERLATTRMVWRIIPSVGRRFPQHLAHPASCKMSMGSFPGVKTAGAWS